MSYRNRSARAGSKSSASISVRPQVESLENRVLLSASMVRPDHIVIVIEQDRASNALGDRANMPYLNSLADTGLVYSNSHGVSHPSQTNFLALYSGSTQGVTSNAQGYSFPTADNLAKSLFNAGLSFSGFAEDMPFDGSQANWAPGDGAGATWPDLYVRFLNPMAMFGDVGIDPATQSPRPNSAVNRTFGAFSSIPSNDYSSLPAVSFIIPNNLHSTHGSNEAYPWAGSSDPDNNNLLRRNADSWLRQNFDAYLQWARQNNSLLVVTQDEEQWVGGSAQTTTTVVNGDNDLFVAGTNSSHVDHYNLLRTISEMYDLAPLGNSAVVPAFEADSAGRLAPDGSAPVQQPSTTLLSASSSTTVNGQSLLLTAQVSAAGSPSGLVSFFDGVNALGTAVLSSAGQATLATSSLAVGAHSVAAVYSGDARFLASSSNAVAVTVQRAATTTSILSSASPSQAGQSISFTAAVAAQSPGGGTAMGTVQFTIDGANFGSPVNLVNGQAVSAATSALSVGNHVIGAVYAGDSSFLASSATTPQVVSAVVLSNDNFANRYTISGASVSAAGTSQGATRESGEPAYGGNTGGKSVWWTWTAPASGNVIIDTAGSNFDTLLGVFKGTAVNALTVVGSNDDDWASGVITSKVSFAATVGTKYQIAVDGYGGVYGRITLNVKMALAAPSSVSATDGTYRDRVRITWGAVSGAARYEVWRGVSNNLASASRIDPGNLTARSFNDTTAMAGVTYWYWVRGVSDSTLGLFSAANSGYRAL